ncbi:MAG: nitronate monooxygenase [Dehalococcoidia bacterium]|nr:nitronate monooxygenase [Dehalococcoidia bacterium]
MKKSRICELLGIKYPIIQAPMNWITWAELAAAVSNAGGLGVIGPNAGERTPTPDAVETGERLRRQIRKARSLTNKPFGVNLVLALTDYPPGGKAFSDQCFKVILEEKAPVVVLVGGTPSIYTRELKAAGIKVLHRALPVNVEAARRSEQQGVDALVAVGFDGGGHVGHDSIPTFVLIPQIVSAVSIPVVAGGGIMDGRGMAAALALGAEGVYMGTRFIITKECPAHQSFKQAIIEASDTGTGTCVGAIGVLRALKNPMLEQCIQMEKSGAEAIARSKTYAPGFRTGMLEGDLVGGTLGCGAGAGLVRQIKSAAEVVQETVRDAEQILAGLATASQR